jgi:hypothetical protein
VRGVAAEAARLLRSGYRCLRDLAAEPPDWRSSVTDDGLICVHVSSVRQGEIVLAVGAQGIGEVGMKFNMTPTTALALAEKLARLARWQGAASSGECVP